MQFRVAINGACLLMLLESGSTHNLIDTKVAARVGIILFEHGDLRVAVANNDRLTSPGCCRAMSVSITGEEFSIDCYGWTLGSYEMVLGVHGLESLGPILWYFSRRTMAFTRNGHRDTRTASGAAAPSPIPLFSATGDIMEASLDEFEPLLAMPYGLPSEHARTHRIQLLLGMVPILVHACP
jgi:hypothetical protein